MNETLSFASCSNVMHTMTPRLCLPCTCCCLHFMTISHSLPALWPCGMLFTRHNRICIPNAVRVMEMMALLDSMRPIVQMSFHEGRQQPRVQTCSRPSQKSCGMLGQLRMQVELQIAQHPKAQHLQLNPQCFSMMSMRRSSWISSALQGSGGILRHV